MPDEACTEAMMHTAQLTGSSAAALWVGQFIYFRFAAKEDSERLSDLLKVTQLMHDRGVKKMWLLWCPPLVNSYAQSLRNYPLLWSRSLLWTPAQNPFRAVISKEQVQGDERGVCEGPGLKVRVACTCPNPTRW